MRKAILVLGRNHAKAELNIDHFVVETRELDTRSLADWLRYWHGLWSHRKVSERWKGYVALELGTEADDDAACTLLKQVKSELART